MEPRNITNMTMFTSGFSLLPLTMVRFQPVNISKTIAGATVPIEILINKLQENAKIGRKKQEKNTYLKTSHLTRERQTLFDGPSKHRKKKSALRTNSPLKTRLLKKEYLHIKPLGWIPTQFVEHKRRKTKKYCHYSGFWEIFGVRH